MSELFATALLGSLLGSLHCVGMCGPFVVFYAEGERRRGTFGLPHLVYNGGRLLAYLLLGSIAGAFGSALDRAGASTGIQNVAAFAAAVFMVSYGALSTWRAVRPSRATISIGAPSRSSRWLSNALLRVRRAPAFGRALVVGLGTGLLPCGWLYGFVAMAAGTGSPWLGAAMMGAFWLGTVPAMFGAGLGLETAAARLGPRLPVLMPALVLSLGLVSLAQRGIAAMSPPSASTPVCHHEDR